MQGGRIRQGVRLARFVGREKRRETDGGTEPDIMLIGGRSRGKERWGEQQREGRVNSGNSTHFMLKPGL